MFKTTKQSATLKKTDEFSSVFNFRKRISAKFIALHYQPNQRMHPRLGLVVSKKIAKSAVARNYMRRVLRECFRLQFSHITHVDLIVRVQKKFDKRASATISEEFNQLIKQLNSRMPPPILPKPL